jgi:hypothetical protein
MRIKFSFILLTFVCTNCCQAQYNVPDSIKKCLYGNWILLTHHGEVPKISFDTSAHILIVKEANDSFYNYQYKVIGDSLFATGIKNAMKARIIFTECDLLQLEFEDDAFRHVARYRRLRPILKN